MISRLATLLAQFLYTHKRLDLPGMGSFLLDESYTAETETGRHQKNVPAGSISFENNARVGVSPELIQYISSQTGKIKALAAADLDSHLELAQQFMNIGKPFLFEGIGTVVKIRSGEFEFTPGAMHDIIKDQPVKESHNTVAQEEAPTDYKSVFYPQKPKTKWKKPVAVILLIAGLVFAIWGGYTVYKRTTGKKDQPSTSKNEVELIPEKDSTRVKNDTASTVAYPIIAQAGTFKFVLESSPTERAFARFSKLKTFQWDVQMETKDSLIYTIFMLLPASAADTTRLIDSLSMLTGRKVWVEYLP